MSTATATNSIAQKLATIFGLGAALTATYSKSNVAYTDGKTKLEFPVTEENTKDAGIYDVKVVSETEVTETFKEAAKAATAAGSKTSQVGARQSPSYGFQQKQPR